MAGGGLIVLVSVAAWGERYPSARFLTLAVAMGLGAGIYLVAPHPATPFQQSTFLTALLLGLFAIIPNRCNRPPVDWTEASQSHRRPR